MVVYQVNLIIEPAIVEEYQAWLRGHVDDMLTLPGFEGAEVLHEVDLAEQREQPHHITVQYRLASLDALNHYLEKDASTMRATAEQRFGGQFIATRKVYSAAGALKP